MDPIFRSNNAAPKYFIGIKQMTQAARVPSGGDLQAARMPCSSFKVLHAGDAQNANKARTASACVLLAATEPENVVVICTAPGKGPSTGMPPPPRIPPSC